MASAMPAVRVQGAPVAVSVAPLASASAPVGAASSAVGVSDTVSTCAPVANPGSAAKACIDEAETVASADSVAWLAPCAASSAEPGEAAANIASSSTRLAAVSTTAIGPENTRFGSWVRATSCASVSVKPAALRPVSGTICSCAASARAPLVRVRRPAGVSATVSGLASAAIPGSAASALAVVALTVTGASRPTLPAIDRPGATPDASSPAGVSRTASTWPPRPKFAICASVLAMAADTVASADSTGTTWVGSDPVAALAIVGARAVKAAAVSVTVMALTKPATDRLLSPSRMENWAAEIV